MCQRFREKSGKRGMLVSKMLYIVSLNCVSQGQNTEAQKLDDLHLPHKMVPRVLDNTAERCILFFWWFSLSVYGKGSREVIWRTMKHLAEGCISVRRRRGQHEGWPSGPAGERTVTREVSTEKRSQVRACPHCGSWSSLGTNTIRSVSLKAHRGSLQGDGLRVLPGAGLPWWLRW